MKFTKNGNFTMPNLACISKITGMSYIFASVCSNWELCVLTCQCNTVVYLGSFIFQLYNTMFELGMYVFFYLACMCSFTWHICVLLLGSYVFFYLTSMCSFTWHICVLLLGSYVFFYLACMCSFTWHICVLLLGMYVVFFYLACMYWHVCILLLDTYVFFYLACMLCSFTWHVCCVLLLGMYVVFFYLACMCSFTWHLCVLLLGIYVLQLCSYVLYLGNSPFLSF